MADTSAPSLVPCPKCEGCGKLASDNLKSWNQFRGLEYKSDEMKGVREGTTLPVVCPDCNGTGQVEKATPFSPAKPAAQQPQS